MLKKLFGKDSFFKLKPKNRRTTVNTFRSDPILDLSPDEVPDFDDLMGRKKVVLP